MKNRDLAKATGFKKNTIDVFFSETSNRDKSENVAKAISATLRVEI